MTGEHLQQLIELDRLIHEPARLLIISYLSLVEEADFLFLLRESQLTRGNLSTHLSKLETNGYIESEKGYIGKKPHTKYRITPQGKEALERYRTSLKDALEL
ncbi:MAG: transcriptional regulator [Chloroflexota bacterium]